MKIRLPAVSALKTTKDPGSRMLACTDGINQPFNPNDKIALNYLYK